MELLTLWLWPLVALVVLLAIVYFGLHVVGRGIILGVALAAGLYFSLLLSTQWESMDLPTGPTIVCIFGLTLAASGALAYLQHRRERRRPAS